MKAFAVVSLLTGEILKADKDERDPVAALAIYATAEEAEREMKEWFIDDPVEVRQFEIKECP